MENTENYARQHFPDSHVRVHRDSLEVEGEGLGSVGCTATRPEAQGQGIATRMVQAGTQYLKDQGMKKAFLGYTYTDILRMYGRAGYTVCQEYFMAEKRF